MFEKQYPRVRTFESLGRKWDSIKSKLYDKIKEFNDNIPISYIIYNYKVVKDHVTLHGNTVIEDALQINNLCVIDMSGLCYRIKCHPKGARPEYNWHNFEPISSNNQWYSVDDCYDNFRIIDETKSISKPIHWSLVDKVISKLNGAVNEIGIMDLLFN